MKEVHDTGAQGKRKDTFPRNLAAGYGIGRMKERGDGRRLRALKSWTLNKCGIVLVRRHARGRCLSGTWRGSAVLERILVLRRVTGRTGKPAARNAKGHGAPPGPAPSSTSFPWSLGNCSIK